MKRFGFIIVLVVISCVQTIFAQQRTMMTDGIYLTTYGNVTVIENDRTQQTIVIKVIKSDNLYDIMCGDTVVKTVAKAAIREGIAYAVNTYTTIPTWVTRPIINQIVDKAYDGVCNALR